MTGRATFDPGDKARRTQSALARPDQALRQIGAIAVAESQAAFAAQRHGNKSWRARSTPNVMGIIADFSAGRTPPGRRFDARPALRDTGALARSIAFQVRSPVVEWGSNLHYARLHQFGGTSRSATITGTIRTKLWKWLQRQSREIRVQLGWLLNDKFRGQSITSRIPARPFVGITQRTRMAVQRIIGVEIMEVR